MFGEDALTEEGDPVDVEVAIGADEREASFGVAVGAREFARIFAADAGSCSEEDDQHGSDSSSASG